MADDVRVVNRRLEASANAALIGMARMGAAWWETELHSEAEQAALR